MSADLLERASASPAEAPRSRRRADIQGLRAVAVLLVVAFHAGLPVPGGFVGVDVFFVISGFVITAMLMREWATHDRLRFRHFYFRRFLRLTPALALTVTVVALASILLQNPFGAQQATARTGLGAMLLSANFTIAHAAGDYFAQNAVTNPLLNTWSLSVEEQFYLAFPALLALGWASVRRARHRATPPMVLVPVLVVAGVSFALSVAWSHGSTFASGLTEYFGGAESFAFYSPFTRAWEFAVGAVLALVLPRLAVLSSRVARLLGLLGLGLIAGAALLVDESMAFPGWIALVPVAGTAIVIHSGSHHTTGVSRVLAIPPMVLVGDISYSWYLWHWPVIVYTALLFPNRPVLLVAAAAASIVPALLSYRLVEQPLRRLRPRTRTGAASLVVVTVGIPLATCALLLTGASTGWGLVPPSAVVTTVTDLASPPPVSSPGASNRPVAPDRATAEQQADSAVDDGEVAGGEGGSLRSQHVAVRAGCVNTDLDPARCTFGPQSPTGTVLLAGDSQAYALADGVIAAAESIGMDTIVTSHTGCPFLGRESSGVHNYPCRAWQRSIVDYARAERPDVVVIANRSAGYVHPEWGWRTAARDDGGRADSVDEAAALWRRGLEPVVADLTRAGVGVVIIGAVPEMTGYTDRTSLLAAAIGSRDFEVSRQDSEADRRPALDVENAVARAYPGVIVYDPNPALCGDESCSATRDGTPVYQDETHLAVPGSLLLADGLASAINRAAGGSP